MRIRILTSCALGLTLAMGVAAAQKPSPSPKTAKADQRITISKGEVASAVDTVYVTRFDTVFITRADTVRLPFAVVKHDTVVMTAPAPMPVIPVKGPFYAGFLAGSTLPSGNIDRLYSTGFHLGALVGVEQDDALLGGRLTATIAQLGRHSGFASNQVGANTPLLLTLSGDLKVMPLTFGTWRLYGVGGVNYNAYRDIATVARNGTGFTAAQGWYVPAKTGWTNRFGFNVGGGADFELAGQSMFIESRAMTFHSDGARSWFVPISLGLRYF